MAGNFPFLPARGIHFPYHSLMSLGIVGSLPFLQGRAFSQDTFLLTICRKSVSKTQFGESIYCPIDTIILGAKYTRLLFHHNCTIIIKKLPQSFSLSA